MAIYFVNVICPEGYPFDDHCAVFTAEEYGSDEAAEAAAAEYYDFLWKDEWLGEGSAYRIAAFALSS
jgi:hypothetical protein